MSLRTSVIVLCFALAANVLFFAFYVLPKLNAANAANAQANLALCVLRTDLQRRVDDSRRFLSQHPDGIPGIPAKQIRNSMDGQQRTISALRVLKCPPSKP